MSELFGSIAIPETPICGKSSNKFTHEDPEFVDFQIPPAGAPTYHMLELLGSTAMAFTLPCPGNLPEKGEVLTGPIDVQLLISLTFPVPATLFFQL